MHKSLIAYYRVSTQKQGRSGLGLEAQQTAIANFAKTEGLKVIGEYTEIETGKGADALDRRPKLAAASKQPANKALVFAWQNSTDVGTSGLGRMRTASSTHQLPPLRADEGSVGFAKRFSG